MKYFLIIAALSSLAQCRFEPPRYEHLESTSQKRTEMFQNPVYNNQDYHQPSNYQPSEIKSTKTEEVDKYIPQWNRINIVATLRQNPNIKEYNNIEYYPVQNRNTEVYTAMHEKEKMRYPTESSEEKTYETYEISREAVPTNTVNEHESYQYSHPQMPSERNVHNVLYKSRSMLQKLEVSQLKEMDESKALSQKTESHDLYEKQSERNNAGNKQPLNYESGFSADENPVPQPNIQVTPEYLPVSQNDGNENENMDSSAHLPDTENKDFKSSSVHQDVKEKKTEISRDSESGNVSVKISDKTLKEHPPVENEDHVHSVSSIPSFDLPHDAFTNIPKSVFQHIDVLEGNPVFPSGFGSYGDKIGTHDGQIDDLEPWRHQFYSLDGFHDDNPVPQDFEAIKFSQKFWPSNTPIYTNFGNTAYYPFSPVW